MEVACLVLSIVLFCMTGLYYLKAVRITRAAERRIKVLRGAKYARPRMQVQGLQRQERGGTHLRHVHPKAANAKTQKFGKKRKKAINKIYGGNG